ncbi:hypothetical protein MPTK1_8g01170 [Marchantia polymorpha subsp. ruderalis]|uniref:RING-CH-type domain-containing protein n=1 Tax=Marchantia polymorpha TaxID=3197 RepID=A0A2R6WRF7_MARPO|nr:hypothetical protein MARPO_0064s0081 [Marchantia polymorpha]BBN18268.1 hypothetical protein Mp_8g01170 [Marchantia polymorpha subsp. ruderalis]|eukprot:PTQ36404.1 hypothetical protein MARPO_0064s0081 [Marchantia polymorpha]
MEVPEAERLARGNLEEMQPSSSSEDSGLRVTNRSDVKNSQEIECVENGAGFSDRNVDIDLDRGEKMPSQQVHDPGPSSPRDQRSGETGPQVVDADSSRVNESLGASQVAGSDETRYILDPIPAEGIPISVAAEEVGSTQGPIPPLATVNAAEAPAIISKKTDSHVIDVPVKDSVKVQELDGYKGFPIPRTTSNFSVESATGDLCRICQQHSDEPVMELGCHCRGELAKAHRSCIEQWFGNKGTNKCEVCQHVATNVPAPSSQPTPHFWVWRVGGGNYNNGGTQRRTGGARFHPLWAALLILIAGLLFDVLISIFLGASALPVNIIIGVLVVLGLGTAARLVLECWHERVIRRNIRRMEEESNMDDFAADQSTTINIHTATLQSTNLPSPEPPRAPAGQDTEGAPQIATRASTVGATT